MRYELTDYQQEATQSVLQWLYWGGEDWHTRGGSAFVVCPIGHYRRW